MYTYLIVFVSCIVFINCLYAIITLSLKLQDKEEYIKICDKKLYSLNNTINLNYKYITELELKIQKLELNIVKGDNV